MNRELSKALKNPVVPEDLQKKIKATLQQHAAFGTERHDQGEERNKSASRSVSSAAGLGKKKNEWEMSVEEEQEEDLLPPLEINRLSPLPWTPWYAHDYTKLNAHNIPSQEDAKKNRQRLVRML